MEKQQFKNELSWYILWSPQGFGNNAAKLVELWNVVEKSDAGAEMYFPTFLDHVRDRDILVPLFPNYVFLKCRWHLGLEDRIRENSGVYVTFLCPVGQAYPYRMTNAELERVKESLEEHVETARQWWHMDDLQIGDRVLVKSSRNLVGTIIYFLPPHRAMIETGLFNRTSPMPVKVADLEHL